MFERLRKSNFRIQLDKSEILKKETAYLGHIITPTGIKPNPDKISCIQKFPIPKTSKEIKSFLGLLGYYRKFIPDFAKITKPMTSCLKKRAKIVLNSDYRQCFETCKELLTNEPILQYPDFSLPFNLTTDASQFAIGAVLSQGTPSKDKPVAFASRTLNQSEQNYSTIERELLAIVWGTKYFRPYLYGQKFTIFTDHKPLHWLFSIKDPNARLTRWRLKLEEYDYTIMYKKGTLNSNADALSRVKINEINTSVACNEQKLIDIDNISISGNINENPDINDIENYPLSETSDINTVHTSHENPILEIPISETAINNFNNQIFFKIVLQTPEIPKIYRLFQNKIRTVIEISKHEFEKDIINTFRELSTIKKTFGINIDKEEFVPRFCEVMKNTFKNSAFKLLLCNTVLEDVKTPELRDQIVKLAHESKTNHRGIVEIESEIKRKYYWPNIRSSVTKVIYNCELCQVMKYDRNPQQQKFELTPTPSKPFEIIHADTFTIKNQKFLTLIDTFSKYAQAYPLTALTAIHVTRAFISFMAHHGSPKLLVLDNGSELRNKIMKDFATLHNINIHYIIPLNPTSNGVIERFHLTLTEHLRIIGALKKDLNILDQMPYAILGYNHSIHSTTKQRPIDIINGHLDLNNPFDININSMLYTNYISQHKKITEEIYKNLNKQISKNKETTLDRRNLNRSNALTYEPGMQAYHKTRERNKANPRFKTHEITNDNRITIDTPTNTYHKNNLRKPLNNQKKK